jgi:head-tail adaptor
VVGDRRLAAADTADAGRRRLQEDDHEEMEDPIALYDNVRNRSGKEVMTRQQTPADQERSFWVSTRSGLSFLGREPRKPFVPKIVRR